MAEDGPLSVNELEDLINREMGELNVITNILDKKKKKNNENLLEIDNDQKAIEPKLNVKNQESKKAAKPSIKFNHSANKENIGKSPAKGSNDDKCSKQNSKNNGAGYYNKNEEPKTSNTQNCQNKSLSQQKRPSKANLTKASLPKPSKDVAKKTPVMKNQRLRSIEQSPNQFDQRNSSNPKSRSYNSESSEKQNSKISKGQTQKFSSKGCEKSQSLIANSHESFYNLDLSNVNQQQKNNNDNGPKKELPFFDEDDLFSRLNKISHISEKNLQDVTNMESLHFSNLKNMLPENNNSCSPFIQLNPTEENKKLENSNQGKKLYPTVNDFSAENFQKKTADNACKLPMKKDKSDKFLTNIKRSSNNVKQRPSMGKPEQQQINQTAANEYRGEETYQSLRPTSQHRRSSSGGIPQKLKSSNCSTNANTIIPNCSNQVSKTHTRNSSINANIPKGNDNKKLDKDVKNIRKTYNAVIYSKDNNEDKKDEDFFYHMANKNTKEEKNYDSRSNSQKNDSDRDGKKHNAGMKYNIENFCKKYTETDEDSDMEYSNQEKCDPEEFLRRKLECFREKKNFIELNKKNLTPQKKTPRDNHDDFQKPTEKKVSPMKWEPKVHRKKIEVVEYSFQPMLSKQSLLIADTQADPKERLYSTTANTNNQQSYQPFDNFDNKNNQGISQGLPNTVTGQIQAQECTFKPRINEMSKYLDSLNNDNGEDQGSRFEQLNKMKDYYTARKEMLIQKKQMEEEINHKQLTFKPSKSTNQNYVPHITMDTDIATRSHQWQVKKMEKLEQEKKKREDVSVNNYSYAPKIVTIFWFKKTQNEKKNIQKDIDAHYSSRFMQQGLVSHFSRIEKAKKEKQDKEDRLSNFFFVNKKQMGLVKRRTVGIITLMLRIEAMVII